MTCCIVCGDGLDRARGARADRCRTCYAYHRRHGTDRPEDLIIRLTVRDVEREVMRRLDMLGTLRLNVARPVGGPLRVRRKT